MTAKQLFKNSLIELSKVNAPALKLYEFNYYINKAISQYINTIYNIYDVNQQTTDDLRVLQGTVYLTPSLVSKSNQPIVGQDTDLKEANYLTSRYNQISSLYGAAYECWLPMDYLHILNCICTFRVKAPYDCYDANTYIQKPATRLTADAWPIVMDDIYNRPTHEKPYYQVYNQNRRTVDSLPTDPVTEVDVEAEIPEVIKANVQAALAAKKQYDENPTTAPKPTEQQLEYISIYNKLVEGKAHAHGTDIDGVYGVETYDDDKLAKGEQKGSNFKRTFTFSNGHKESLVERTAAQRIGNPSNVRLEVRYGRDNSLFELVEVQVDYIKVPQYIRLTQEQLDLTQDVSQMLEWPDYICQEITNILVRLLMERTGDPRLANNTQINQTIARPNQGQQQQAAPQAQ